MSKKRPQRGNDGCGERRDGESLRRSFDKARDRKGQGHEDRAAQHKSSGRDGQHHWKIKEMGT